MTVLRRKLQMAAVLAMGMSVSNSAFLVFPIAGQALSAAAVLNACMPMMSVYPILAQKYGQEGLCAAALVATTVTSFFTISGFPWLSGTAG